MWDFFNYYFLFVLFEVLLSLECYFLSLDLYLFNFLVCKFSAMYVRVATGKNVTQL